MINSVDSKKRIKKVSLWTTIKNVVLWTSAIAFLFPLYWMITGSFKAQSVNIKMPPDMIPLDPTIANYLSLAGKALMGRWFLNSLFIASVGVLIGGLVASLAGYALAKKKFRGKNIIFWVIVATMMIPQHLLLVPLFRIVMQLHLINNLFAAILPAAGAPFGVFMMKQFTQTLPGEIFDAGKIDGCSEARLYFNIVLPMTLPAIGVVAIFGFAGMWNNYLWQLIVLTKRNVLTLPVGIALLKQQYVAEYGLQMAAGVLGAAPIIIFFLIFQKTFMKGISLGAIKG